MKRLPLCLDLSKYSVSLGLASLPSGEARSARETGRGGSQSLRGAGSWSGSPFASLETLGTRTTINTSLSIHALA